jgi:hypothetical protein
MAPALSLCSPLRWKPDVMEPDGTQQGNREKDGEDDYRHSSVLSCCIQNTPLAHSVQCTFHGRCPLLREEGTQAGRTSKTTISDSLFRRWREVLSASDYEEHGWRGKAHKKEDELG